MDTTNNPELPGSQPAQPESMVLGFQAIEHLKQTRKWTSFLSIVTFVMLGLMVVFVIMMAVMFTSRPGMMGFLPVIPLVVLVVIYFFPVYYLFQFSKFAKQATVHYDALALTQALRYLQMHYRFMGILVIILFGFYVLMGFMALHKFVHLSV
jgi:hypothetical protein